MASKCIVGGLFVLNLIASVHCQPSIVSNGDMMIVDAQDGFSVNNVDILKAITDLTDALAVSQNNLATTTNDLGNTQNLLSQTRTELTDAKNQLQIASAKTTDNQGSITSALDRITSTTVDVTAVNNSVITLGNVSTDLRAISSSNGDRIEALEQTLQIMSEQFNSLNYSFYKDDGFSRSCLEHYENGARIDGSYPIQEFSDSEVTTVYCDMKNGGWTLAAIVHTCTNQQSRTREPRDFWSSGQQRTSPFLQKNVNKDCRQPMAIGTTHLLPQVTRSDAPMLKVVFHAEEDPTFTSEWYKAVTEDSFKTYFQATNAAYRTQACTDEAMSLNCRPTLIVKRPATTNFEGMYVYDNQGPITTYTPHMRMDDDVDGFKTGVCSMTMKDKRWPDSAGDGHWGNGVRLWVKA